MICIILVKKKSGISNKRYGIKFQDPEYSNQMKLVEKKIEQSLYDTLKAAANKRLGAMEAERIYTDRPVRLSATVRADRINLSCIS